MLMLNYVFLTWSSCKLQPLCGGGTVMVIIMILNESCKTFVI
jgi:hypothetical protein